MRYIIKYTIQMVAFLLTGSAALLLSCNSPKMEQVNKETLVTLRSDSVKMVVSRNGNKSYTFMADILEQYGLAREPYTLYPKGIFVERFKDSTNVIESTIRANQAVYYDKRDLWMISGNVVASGSDRTLYTEQLFWDAKTKRVYSNVRSRIVDADGQHIGEGFESDETMNQWMFRNYEGTMALDTTPVTEEETQTAKKSEEVNQKENQPTTGSTVTTPRPSAGRVMMNPNVGIGNNKSRVDNSQNRR